MEFVSGEKTEEMPPPKIASVENPTMTIQVC